MTSMCKATTRALPGAAVIELSGEVDGSAAGVLTAAYERAVGDTGADPGTVVLDFRPLPGDLRYHQAVGLHRALPRCRPRRQPAHRTCRLAATTHHNLME
jgi:hypothetical protein